VLRPGGALCVMDMNPQSPHFLRMLSQPFLFAAFKSTEPYLEEYMTMDMLAELDNTGFVNAQIRSSSPRHRTVVALKSA
jgi:hypothetical protein